MKKLLIASSALVAAAGSAAALDVSLGGEIKITGSIDLANSGQPNGAAVDAKVTLKASGESMGWTYGGTLNIAMAEAEDATDSDNDGYGINDLYVSGVSAYMGGDFMGRIALQNECGDFVKAFDPPEHVMVGHTEGGNCLQWTGMEFGGFGISAAMSLDNVTADNTNTADPQDSMIVGLTGDVMGVSLAAEYGLDSENIDVKGSMDLMGMGVGFVAIYDAKGAAGPSGDALTYALSTSTTLAGFDVALAYAPEGRGTDFGGGKKLDVDFSQGCYMLKLDIDPTSNDNDVDDDADTANALDGIYGWEAGYDCAIHDGFNLKATLKQAEASTALGELGNITGNIEAKVTF